MALAAEYPAFAAQLDAMPHPRAAVLIGGKSKAFDLSEARATALADGLERALDAANASLLMTFSRRTPDAARTILTARLQGRPGMIWDGEGRIFRCQPLGRDPMGRSGDGEDVVAGDPVVTGRGDQIEVRQRQVRVLGLDHEGASARPPLHVHGKGQGGPPGGDPQVWPGRSDRIGVRG